MKRKTVYRAGSLIVATVLITACQSVGPNPLGKQAVKSHDAANSKALQTAEQVSMEALKQASDQQSGTSAHIPLSHSHSSSQSSWDTGQQGGCQQTKHGKTCHFSEQGGTTRTTHSSSSSLDIDIK